MANFLFDIDIYIFLISRNFLPYIYILQFESTFDFYFPFVDFSSSCILIDTITITEMAGIVRRIIQTAKAPSAIGPYRYRFIFLILMTTMYKNNN